VEPTYTQCCVSVLECPPAKVTDELVKVVPGAGDATDGGRLLVVVVVPSEVLVEELPP
jgi:hypothetical protein